MTKQFNLGLTQTSRRNVLRGTVLAGAAAMTGAAAMATPRRAAVPNAQPPVARFLEAEAQAQVAAARVDLSGYTRVKQDLVAPPFAPVHEQVATGGPKLIEIYMETTERLMVVDEDTGASIWALTYNGSVPGPLIICHEGDMIELTLRNPVDSMMEHNIDFHASTGALGGGGLTHVFPGEETVLRWKATKPGCFTYHCAPGGAMIAYHVCHGMNGAVMVLPRDGLKDVDGNPLPYDGIAYIGEQDCYLPTDEFGD
jgi:nitrite reductase (NO-forming)